MVMGPLQEIVVNFHQARDELLVRHWELAAPFQDVSGVDVPLNQAIEYDKYYIPPKWHVQWKKEDKPSTLEASDFETNRCQRLSTCCGCPHLHKQIMCLWANI